jgi:hypothetical protein
MKWDSARGLDEDGIVADVPSDEEPSTDDDVSLVDEPEKRLEWRQYELDVASSLQALDPRAAVRHDVKVIGSISGAQRQIDVLAESAIVGQQHRVVIECKFYKRKLGIGKVDEFIGKLLDIGAESGILYGFSGVTEPARRRAENAHNPKVSIRDLAEATRPMREFAHLSQAGLIAHSWATEINQALGLGPCDNPNCFENEVTFGEWPGGEMAGYCGSCGTFNVLCSECEDTIAAEIGENTCYSCGAVYEVGHDGSGEYTSVTRVLQPEGNS